MLRRNSAVARTNTGRVTKAISASFRSRASMAMKIMPTFSRSPTTETIPSEMNSRIDSTSFVTLVSVLPAAVLS